MFKKLITLAIMASISIVAVGQTANLEAFDNATVRPDGPRGGTNGKAFFNVEGNQNGIFASYGVADFNFGFSFNPGLTHILFVQMTLVSDVAGFSQDGGPIDVYLTNDTTTSIQPGPEPPAQCYFDANSLPNGIGSQFGTKWSLGSFQWNGILQGGADGDTYHLFNGHLDLQAESYLRNQLNSQSNVRLIVAPGDINGDGSFAGFSHNTIAGPQLQICATNGSLLTGQIILQDYEGALPLFSTIDYYDSDGNIDASDYIVWRQGLGHDFKAKTPDVPGIYYPSLQWGTFLRQKLGPIDTTTNQTINFELINGDVELDNEVNLVDYASVSASFGSVHGDPNWNPRADLNGDGEVNLFDAGIVSANFGLAGDE